MGLSGLSALRSRSCANRTYTAVRPPSTAGGLGASSEAGAVGERVDVRSRGPALRSKPLTAAMRSSASKPICALGSPPKDRARRWVTCTSRSSTCSDRGLPRRSITSHLAARRLRFPDWRVQTTPVRHVEGPEGPFSCSGGANSFATCPSGRGLYSPGFPERAHHQCTTPTYVSQVATQLSGSLLGCYLM